MDKQTILQYEAMAKLSLREDVRAWAMDVMSTLEDSFQRLRDIDTAGVEPLISVLPLQNVLRDDVAVQLVSRDELLSNAPEEYNGYFQVPKTLE